MASFVHVVEAVMCAVAVQKAFANHNQRAPQESLPVRVGLSAGEPVDDNYLGDPSYFSWQQ